MYGTILSYTKNKNQEKMDNVNVQMCFFSPKYKSLSNWIGLVISLG